MTKLDTLLLELEKLDRKKPPEASILWQAQITGRSKEDVAFIVKAVDSNKVLREVIKIQRAALEEISEWCTEPEHTPDCKIARQALEAAEKVCEEQK